MKLGPVAMEELRLQVTGKLEAGEELVVIGTIAIEMTERLLEREKRFLEHHFSPSFLRETRMLRNHYALSGPITENPLWQIAGEMGASCLIPVGEDGFLAALWKMAEASEVGLEADLRAVPIRQETIEICECFDVNPYEAPSAGAFLAGFVHAFPFLELCEQRGIPAVCIGQANGQKARLLRSGESVRYLDRPRKV